MIIIDKISNKLRKRAVEYVNDLPFGVKYVTSGAIGTAAGEELANLLHEYEAKDLHVGFFANNMRGAIVFSVNEDRPILYNPNATIGFGDIGDDISLRLMAQIGVSENERKSVLSKGKRRALRGPYVIVV